MPKTAKAKIWPLKTLGVNSTKKHLTMFCTLEWQG
jgi:hypothetical protein